MVHRGVWSKKCWSQLLDWYEQIGRCSVSRTLSDSSRLLRWKSELSGAVYMMMKARKEGSVALSFALMVPNVLTGCIGTLVRDPLHSIN